MSDAARLYQEIMGLINDMLPDLLAENRITLAQMITGILQSKQVQFRKVAQKVNYRFKKPSLEDKFRRFVRNPNIEVEVAYLPFARFIVSALSKCQEQLVLMIDGSKVGGGCICLMVSILYKGRALPLCWLVYKGKKGHSSMETQLTLLKVIQSLLPSDAPQVILLGDGEFDGSTVIDWMDTKTSWKYACRTALDTKVFYQGKWVALQDLALQEGQEAFFEQVLFTESGQVGPANIAAIWNKKENCHWFIVTNFETLDDTKKWYGKRFVIETLFSDIKGRGFNVDKTRLFKPDRVSRLLLAVAIADLFAVFLGVELIHSGRLGQLVRIDDAYYSLFQLGLIYLDHLLNECLSFPTLKLRPPDSFYYLSFV
jgi:hypothetical protein